MKRRVSLFIQFVVFVLLLGAAGALWHAREDAGALFARLTGGETENAGRRGRAGGGAIPVVVARVSRAANDTVIEAVGTGRARRSVTLYPEAAGEIVAFGVRSGARVTAGESILQLDASDAERAIEVARTRHLEAQRQLERAERLFSRKVTSQATVDDARNLARRAGIELNQAEEDLAKRELRAPFDGIVGIPKVELGDRIATTTEVITLDDRTELYVEFAIPEQYVSRVSIGTQVLAHTPSYGPRDFKGAIDQIDSRVNPTTRSITARAVLPNTEDLLRPGMSFAVEVALSGEEFPVVPELALVWSDGQSHVWQVTDGKAAKVAVQIVKRMNRRILVEGDLAEDELVVVEGLQRLRPGLAVDFGSAPPERTALSN